MPETDSPATGSFEPPQDKIRLLWISDSPRLAHIGQGIVSREILNRLDPERWDITVLGFGDEKVRDPVDVPYRIIHLGRSDMKNVDLLAQHIKDCRPQIVFFSHDIFLFPTVAQLKEIVPSTKFVGYITVDGIPIFSGWRPMYYAYDLIITPSEWGRRELLKQWLDLDVVAIPYGVNQEIFRPPKTSKAELKELIENTSTQSPYNKRMLVTNHFVGIYYGANQFRKNLGAIYWGWKKFAEGKDDVRFFMLTHSAILDGYMGSYALGPFADAGGFEIIPNEIPQEWLVRLVSMADVLVHPALSEGFGMTITEAMASGTVPIVCDYSAHTDFCNETTAYICNWHPMVGQFNMIRAVAEHDDVANQLEIAYQDWKSGDIEAKRAECVMTARQYTWDKTANAIVENLEALLNKKEQRLIVKHLL